MRLIDADALIENILALPNRSNSFSDTYGKACIIGVIDEQPNIERKTGMWLRAEFGVECNLCKRTQITMTPYCSHCGAEMDC